MQSVHYTGCLCPIHPFEKCSGLAEDIMIHHVIGRGYTLPEKQVNLTNHLQGNI